MSLVAVLDGLIVVLLGVLVVLEILRPRRLRQVLEEVDERTAEATAALDDLQRRLERTLEAADAETPSSAADPDADRRGGRRYERPDRHQDPEPSETPESRRRPEAAASRSSFREPPEIELDWVAESEPQAQELREKIAHLLESSGSERTERERRLLHQLQETLERPAGSDRLEQERMLYRALEAATQEAGPRPGGEPPAEEQELIAKLRRGE